MITGYFNLWNFNSHKTSRTIDYCNVNNDMNVWSLNEPLAFGNSLSHQPLQKVKAGKEKFREIVSRTNQTKNELVDNLIELLCDRERHWPDDELMRRKPMWADKLCSICVNMPEVGYGSRLYFHKFLDQHFNRMLMIMHFFVFIELEP